MGELFKHHNQEVSTTPSQKKKERYIPVVISSIGNAIKKKSIDHGQTKIQVVYSAHSTG